MTVSELIERLKEEEPGADVELQIAGFDRTVRLRSVVTVRCGDAVILSND